MPTTILMKEAQRGSTSNEAAAAIQADAAKEAASREVKRATVDADISSLVGMTGVKKWFDEMKGKVKKWF